MKNLFKYVFMIAAVFIGLRAPSAYAQWIENFDDGYTPGQYDALSAPWEDATVGSTTQYSSPGTGIAGSKGSEGSWPLYGHAWRPAGGQTTLVGSFNLSTPPGSYQGAQIGFTLNKAYDTTSQTFTSGVGGNVVYVEAYGDDATSQGYVRMRAVEGYFNQYTETSPIGGLVYNAYYDIKLELSGGAANGYYKLNSSSTWLAIGTVNTISGFAPNYVGISANRGGYLDNVGAIPEPGGLFAMGIGLMMMARFVIQRRKQGV